MGFRVGVGAPAISLTAVFQLGARERNVFIAGAVRNFLRGKDHRLRFTTYALASKLDDSATNEQIGRLSKILARMAPNLTGFASHDGETIEQDGKKRTRWVWHGQDRSRKPWDMED